MSRYKLTSLVFDSQKADIKFTNEKPTLPVKKKSPKINTGTNYLDILNSPSDTGNEPEERRLDSQQPDKHLSPLTPSAPPPPPPPLPPPAAPPSPSPQPAPQFTSPLPEPTLFDHLTPPSYPAEDGDTTVKPKINLFAELEAQSQFMMGSRDEETMESNSSWTTDDQQPLAESSPREKRRGGGRPPDFSLTGSVRFPVQPDNRMSNIYNNDSMRRFDPTIY
ncbi:putative uncharacterized protein DDB_G0294196 [Pecten maximus]|uniref:putative uncharacterized protein DDB_G0294196 n=1 Tax=Pecten maximus TaxID=6579 RepID=UPI001458AC55|nr:putative uncharacterized protein DDB_G0294196 [Pecten maximus]